MRTVVAVAVVVLAFGCGGGEDCNSECAAICTAIGATGGHCEGPNAVCQCTYADAGTDADADADVLDGVDVGDEPGEAGEDAEAEADAETTPTCPDGMALVPAGPFLMGHDGLDAGTAAPVHEVQLSAFCIDRFEGGEAEFEECIAIGACRRDSTCDPVPHYVPGSAATCVSLSQAEAYCRWHGKRLPTEAEWEKAARGGCEIVEPPGCGGEDLRPYPWGSEPPDCLRARHGECDDPSPVPVDRLPAGDSPYGARNMVGNVLEWVRDRHASYPTVCPPGSPCVDPVQTSGDLSILRGGGWWTAPVVLSLWKRETSSLTGASWETGVRCAADPVW